MSELRLSVRCDIHDGRQADFKALAAACLDCVRDKDTQTLQYEWFLDEHETRCLILERYPDSDALLEHIANLGELFVALLDTCIMKVDIFGSPSQKLLDATAGIPKRVYSFHQGFEK
jgi:quinol monooxygenase YgiN